MKKTLYYKSEAAKLMGISRPSLDKLIKNGLIDHYDFYSKKKNRPDRIYVNIDDFAKIKKTSSGFIKLHNPWY